jgi:hypothetical protein
MLDRIPDDVMRSLGPDAEPLWYAGALQRDAGRSVETVPPPADVDTAALRATPMRVVSGGRHPDGALGDED